MRRGGAALAFVAFLALSAPAPAPADAKSESEAAALRALVERLRAPLEELRGLAFTSALATEQVDRQTARRHIERLLAADYPPALLAAEQEAYRYFGLIGAEDDLEALLLDLLESQVAGFYDPGEKRLFVVPGPMAGSLALVHELAHALEDQHFDLEGLADAARGDDDRTLALSGLIEGSATMVSFLWGIRASMDPSLPPIVEGDTAELMKAAAAGLDDVPAFIKESLLFPYTAGAVWASTVMKRGGGLKALDGWFAEPPGSTEQILHPERSVEQRDLPSVIAPGALPRLSVEEGLLVKMNTMGEFGIRGLLATSDSAGAEKAAEGWDADLYIISRRGEARELSWLSYWDSAGDAAEFEQALRAWLAGRASSSGSPWSVRAEGRVVAAAEGGVGKGASPEDRVAVMMARAAEEIRAR